MSVYPTYHEVKSNLKEELFKSHGYINDGILNSIAEVIFKAVMKASDAASNHSLMQYEKGQFIVKRDIARIIERCKAQNLSSLDTIFEIKQHIRFKMICQNQNSQKKTKKEFTK